MAEKEQTLEKLFTQLEDVIREMEQGEVSLEEAFELYHNLFFLFHHQDHMIQN